MAAFVAFKQHWKAVHGAGTRSGSRMNAYIFRMDEVIVFRGYKPRRNFKIPSNNRNFPYLQNLFAFFLAKGRLQLSHSAL